MEIIGNTLNMNLDPLFAAEQEENANNEDVEDVEEEEEDEEDEEEEEEEEEEQEEEDEEDEEDEYGVQDFLEETQHWLDIISDEESQVLKIYAYCDLYIHLDEKFESFKDEEELQSLFATIHVKTIETLSQMSILALNNISALEIQEAVAYTLPYLSSFLSKLFPRG
jgi:hypothetical protein